MGLDDLRGAEPETTQAIVSKLARALRAERTRGRSGHWTYDPERHLRLCAAFHAESRALKTRPVR
jgi:arginine repressor